MLRSVIRLLWPALVALAVIALPASPGAQAQSPTPSRTPSMLPAATVTRTPGPGTPSRTPSPSPTAAPTASPSPTPTVPITPQADGSPFVVQFAINRDTAIYGEPLAFAIVAPQPGQTYLWDFGDGTPPASGARVTHTYTRIDDFLLRVSAQAGPNGPQTALGARTVRVTPDFRGLFASNVNGQYVPAGIFQLAVAVRSGGLAELRVRTAGAIVAGQDTKFSLQDGENYLLFDRMRIADERDPIIREEIVRKPGGTIPLDAPMFTLALDYTVPSTGQTVTLAPSSRVMDFFVPDRPVAVTYPRVHSFAGVPAEGSGVDNYYLRGDPDFSHVDDFFVRLLALQWGRRGGAWPDDPHEVAMNLYKTIDELLDDGEPADFNNDYNFARLFYDGTLSSTKKNSKHICIAQAYLMTALGRTLGFPAREYNNAIGEASWQGNDGVWRVRWWQEAGLELYYQGVWHYFDPWYGALNRQDYLAKNLIFQSWHAFSPQRTEYMTVKGERTGLYGHNFNAWPGEPPQWSFVEEGVRPGIIVEGMITDPRTPVTLGSDMETKRQAPSPATPAAAGIGALPQAAP